MLPYKEVDSEVGWDGLYNLLQTIDIDYLFVAHCKYVSTFHFQQWNWSSTKFRRGQWETNAG